MTKGDFILVQFANQKFFEQYVGIVEDMEEENMEPVYATSCQLDLFFANLYIHFVK